jgi:hypothetical protein
LGEILSNQDRFEIIKQHLINTMGPVFPEELDAATMSSMFREMPLRSLISLSKATITEEMIGSILDILNS